MVASFVDLGIVVVQAVLVAKKLTAGDWRLQIGEGTKLLESNGIGIRR